MGVFLEPVDVSVARAESGDESLPSSINYYLARVGYIGNQSLHKIVPGGLSLSVDVDDNRTAYVTSYRLTSERGTSEIAVLLSSKIALKGLVSICSAAD
jgi:hypothetical protein